MSGERTLLNRSNWRERLTDALNDDPEFARSCELADESMALVIGEERAWFKLYRGSIIDEEPYVPPFGSTFRLVGDRKAWEELLRGETSLSEALYDGSIRSAGDTLEANRLREALELFVRQMQRLSEVADG
jgi:putative sterol carrier protein